MNLLLSVAVGIALGLAARLLDEVAPKWVGNVGAVWFLAGFLVARLERDPRRGAMIGALCLTSACVSYYAWRVSIDGTISARYLATIGLLWLAASIGVGVLSGAAGAASRTIAAAWGIAAGTFAGEAAAVLILSRRVVQAVVEIFIAVLLVSRAGSRRVLQLAAATTLVVAFIGATYRLALR